MLTVLVVSQLVGLAGGAGRGSPRPATAFRGWSATAAGRGAPGACGCARHRGALPRDGGRRDGDRRADLGRRGRDPVRGRPRVAASAERRSRSPDPASRSSASRVASREPARAGRRPRGRGRAGADRRARLRRSTSSSRTAPPTRACPLGVATCARQSSLLLALAGGARRRRVRCALAERRSPVLAVVGLFDVGANMLFVARDDAGARQHRRRARGALPGRDRRRSRALVLQRAASRLARRRGCGARRAALIARRLITGRAQTLKRMFSTSPSWTTYVLPSSRCVPRFAASACEPASSRSSQSRSPRSG